MYPVAMTIISTGKEYWPSRVSNQQPPVLKSSTLPTELWGAAIIFKQVLLWHFITSHAPCPQLCHHGSWALSGPSLTIVRRISFDCPKFKEVSDNNFRCDKNGWKFIDKKKRKNLSEKEKLPVTSNLPLSLKVFINLYGSNFGMLEYKIPDPCHELIVEIKKKTH